ncbi:MAG: hypothetical protein QNK04_08425 [Myxococcota bacterium]|nr:hypothetical protein [Myxococcota bacterium]
MRRVSFTLRDRLEMAAAGDAFPALVAAVAVPGVLVALLIFDYGGSTPLEGSGHFDGQDWRITLDDEDGAGGRIEPDTLRRFKLNLAGRRSVHVAG